jgi:hypothetical protein
MIHFVEPTSLNSALYCDVVASKQVFTVRPYLVTTFAQDWLDVAGALFPLSLFSNTVCP